MMKEDEHDGRLVDWTTDRLKIAETGISLLFARSHSLEMQPQPIEALSGCLLPVLHGIIIRLVIRFVIRLVIRLVILLLIRLVILPLICLTIHFFIRLKAENLLDNRLFPLLL